MSSQMRYRIQVTLTLLGIIALAVFLRIHTFWLPHWQGDQSQYVTMAMKLDKEPMLKGYHLREVKLNLLNIKGKTPFDLVYPSLQRGVEGDLIQSYKTHGFGYYDMPLFYKAPFWPTVLKYAHRWLTRGDHPYMILKSNLKMRVLTEKPKLIFLAQFWAAVVPFVLSLGVMLMTFVMAYRMFGMGPALYAAFILATNPVSILCAHRLWTEDLMTFLIIWSLMWLFYAHPKKENVACGGAGILFGLAILTNQKTMLIIPAVFLYTLMTTRMGESGTKVWVSRVFNASFIFFMLGILMISGSWFMQVYQTYGHPFWQPETTPDNYNFRIWYEFLKTRPHGTIFYTVGTVAICPPLAAGIIALKPCVVNFWGFLRRGQGDKRLLFLFLWIMSVTAYYIFRLTGEYRYLFPMYPALVTLSGVMLYRFQGVLKKSFVRPKLGYALLAIVLIISSSWSVFVAAESVFEERNLIHAPFYYQPGK